MRARLRRLAAQVGEFGDTATYFSTVVAAQLASLILLPVATRYLTPPVYGEYALALSITGLAGIVGSAWVRNVGMRLYFDHVSEGRTRAFLLTAATLQAATMALTLALSYVVVVVSQQPVSFSLYAAAGGSVLVADFYTLAANTLRAGQRARTFGAAEWTSAVLRVGATWTALAAGFRSPATLFACTTLALALAAAVALRGLATLLTGPPQFEPALARELVRLGAPSVPQSVSSWVMSLSDRVLIARVIDVGAVGLYSAAYNVADRAVGGLMSALLMASWPAMLAAWTTDAARVPAVIARWLGAYALLTLGPAVLLIVQRDFVLGLLLGPAYVDASAVVPWVVAGAWLSGVATYLNRPLELHKHYGLMSALALGCAVLNIALNLVLIPRWGVTGAAAATTAAYAAWAALSRAFAARVLHVAIPWATVAGAVVATAVAVLASRPLMSPLAAVPVYSGVYLALALIVWTRTAPTVATDAASAVPDGTSF